VLRPQSPAELAEALRCAAARGNTIALGGAFSKTAIAGRTTPADVTISTASLNRILKYDPRDLTVSVEAGMPFDELSRVLAAHRQMIPLDPPFSSRATVGGVLAANTSGPRRLLYGTARDMVIGMTFATLEGKLVQSGGMVVKNVAGLDTAKLMIGSFGTLAAIAVANFKVAPIPPASRTLVLSAASLDEVMSARNAVIRGVLQPTAVDLLDPRAAARLGYQGYLLLVRAAGNRAALERYSRALPAASALEGEPEEDLWLRIKNFTPDFMSEHAGATVVRVSCLLTQVGEVVRSTPGPVVARAGSGVVYAYFTGPGAAGEWVREASARGWKVVIEYAPEEAKSNLELWPAPADGLEIMRRIKRLFDPANLLNRGRLYGRI